MLDAGLLHQHTLAIVSTRRQGPTGLGSDNTEAICHLIQNASLHVKQAFDTAWALCHGRADVGGDMDGGPGRGGSLLAGKVQERLSGDEARIPGEAVQCLQRLALVVPTNLRATLEHQLLDTLKRVAEQCLLRRYRPVPGSPGMAWCSEQVGAPVTQLATALALYYEASLHAAHQVGADRSVHGPPASAAAVRAHAPVPRVWAAEAGL